MGTEQIFDGSKIYNISAEDQEVTVAKPTGNEQMFSPLNYIEEYKRLQRKICWKSSCKWCQY